ncbi:hypothetical protein HPB51_011602 [Rhipicephalus microplus]|uniref:Uncharacterized protein n=1 Tax=Rhipicephalus microplus TaxID=6941 RepID=A0A9J6E8V8_RHIMP|nr:hypothetical protein HPB51_011602 [Rhipicephalus microplus]
MVPNTSAITIRDDDGGLWRSTWLVESCEADNGHNFRCDQVTKRSTERVLLRITLATLFFVLPSRRGIGRGRAHSAAPERGPLCVSGGGGSSESAKIERPPADAKPL